MSASLNGYSHLTHKGSPHRLRMTKSTHRRLAPTPVPMRVDSASGCTVLGMLLIVAEAFLGGDEGELGSAFPKAGSNSLKFLRDAVI